MIEQRLQPIVEVINKFTGKTGEPANSTEAYILRSMWVMMLSEFEGGIKDIIEEHLDKMRNTEVNKIHICLLLQNFHPNNEDNLTINKIISVYKKNPKDISYTNFTRDFKPKYKSKAVEKLFNTIGIFLSDVEIANLKMLDSVASTRDSIAHGDNQIQITRKELLTRLSDIKNLYKMLKVKLI